MLADCPTTFRPPFIAQPKAQGERACGAACLAMVYAGFGQPEPIEAIWRRVSEKDAVGELFARTQRLAWDALQRRLSVAVMLPESPYAALRRLHAQGSAVIVNHRLSPSSHWGHFSVVTTCDDECIQLHDPYRAAHRRLAWSEFDQLWRPFADSGETTGYVLLAVQLRQASESESPPCSRCQTQSPLEIPRSLGATARGYLFCPGCDAVSQIEVSKR